MIACVARGGVAPLAFHPNHTPPPLTSPSASSRGCVGPRDCTHCIRLRLGRIRRVERSGIATGGAVKSETGVCNEVQLEDRVPSVPRCRTRAASGHQEMRMIVDWSKRGGGRGRHREARREWREARRQQRLASTTIRLSPPSRLLQLQEHNRHAGRKNRRVRESWGLRYSCGAGRRQPVESSRRAAEARVVPVRRSPFSSFSRGAIRVLLTLPSVHPAHCVPRFRPPSASQGIEVSS